MTMHQEARRRQMFMDRVCEARRRIALAQSNAQNLMIQAESSSSNMDTDRATCTNQGLSDQTQH